MSDTDSPTPLTDEVAGPSHASLDLPKALKVAEELLQAIKQSSGEKNFPPLYSQPPKLPSTPFPPSLTLPSFPLLLSLCRLSPLFAPLPSPSPFRSSESVMPPSSVGGPAE